MMKKIGYTVAAFALPALAFAQTQQITSIQSAGSFIITFINTIAVPVIFALAFIVFIWGIFQTFVMGGSNEEAQAKGKALMIWGIIGIVLMISVWGLVNIVLNSFNIQSSTPHYPTAPTSN